ncbi:molybdopterin-dependent oxidoreductase [bacterium]|nr:molybdopterin-dependent oxidoreductase [bacterium]
MQRETASQMINSMNRRQAMAIGGGIVLSSLITKPSLAQQANGEKDLIFHTTDPARNAEPALDKLVQSWITPNKHFYVRSHAPNPQIDPAAFKLKIEGLVRNPIEISLAELKQRFDQKTTTATLTCAGNRRNEHSKVKKVGGVPWMAGAIGNATWGGSALSDILKKAGVLENGKHVWFEGLDEIEKGGGIIPFGGSIPIEKAMADLESGSPGALLTTMMNGEALTPDHGAPLRMVVPGYVGARSVKWLGKIVVSDRPSPNHYLATAYKVVTKTDPIDWTESGPIYRFPINGAICTPAAKAAVSAGPVELTGYVLPSGSPGNSMKAVDLSIDSGRTWTRATMVGESKPFCWQLWKATVNVKADTKHISLRGTDNAGDFMPGRVKWNAKGYLKNSWYKLPIKVS